MPLRVPSSLALSTFTDTDQHGDTPGILSMEIPGMARIIGAFLHRPKKGYEIEEPSTSNKPRFVELRLTFTLCVLLESNIEIRTEGQRP